MKTVAIGDVIALHSRDLLSLARHLTKNEADALDLVQDTCLHAIEATKDGAEEPQNIKAWLAVVMRNTWFSTLRRHRVRRIAHAELLAHPHWDSALHETRAVARQLTRAWNHLPARAQAIAQQCLLEGDSRDEVSRRFGLSPAGVATLIHRTRASLWQAMFETARASP